MSDYISKITINNNADARDIAAKYAVKRDNSGVFNIDTTYAKKNDAYQDIVARTVIVNSSPVVTEETIKNKNIAINADEIKVRDYSVAVITGDKSISADYFTARSDENKIFSESNFPAGNWEADYHSQGIRVYEYDSQIERKLYFPYENGTLATQKWVQDAMSSNHSSIYQYIEERDDVLSDRISSIETQLAGVEALLQQLNGTGGNN